VAAGAVAVINRDSDKGSGTRLFRLQWEGGENATHHTPLSYIPLLEAAVSDNGPSQPDQRDLPHVDYPCFG
jgi:hypothetical protein